MREKIAIVSQQRSGVKMKMSLSKKEYCANCTFNYTYFHRAEMLVH